MPKIRVRSLSKVFGSNPTPALKLRDEGLKRPEILEKTGMTLGLSNIEFDVNEGELLVIMGLSGSGKSTLIRCLNRLIEPTEGSVEINGQDIVKLDNKGLLRFRRETFGMVFQHFALFPHRTVLENTEYGLEIQGVDKGSRAKKGLEALQLVGLEEWADAYPDQLSGGMQQRVGLSRALAADPDILLMDEAFSALDPLIRRDMQQELLDLQTRMKKTVIFITHDLDEALNLGDRIILLKDGEIVQEGSPEEILTHPANRYVERFIEGVDMTRILTANAAMTPARAVGYLNDGPRTVLHRMRENGMDRMLITTRERKLCGLVEADVLNEAVKRGDRRIQDLLITDLHKVSEDEPLNNLFPMFDERSYPIAVVDEQNRLKGVVVRGSLLAELAQAATVESGQKETPAQPEGEQIV